jgi:integrase
MSDRKISVYDFKHSRISLGANSGAPLAGIAHLVGHKHVSTTALYVTTGEAAAAEALGIMARRSDIRGTIRGTHKADRKDASAKSHPNAQNRRSAKEGT